LFTVGEWKGLLETRPFKPEPNRLAFFKHPGLSPAQIPGTNRIESAVATIPPGHELKLIGRIAVNGVYQPEPAFSTTLTSGPNEPGIYWFTWYLLPNPQRMEREPKPNWELQIQDAFGREWLRSQAPEGLNILWRKKWVGDEPITVRAGKQIREIFFEKAHLAGDRGPTMFLLEMTMQRSLPGEDPARRVAAELEYLLNRYQKLLVQFTPDHPLLMEIRGKIAEAQRKLELLEKAP
jgi:hypothetical protein